MEGFIYYRLPNTSKIVGRRGEWLVLESVNQFQYGVITTSFLKDHIFNMTEYKPIELSFLDDFVCEENEPSFYISKNDYLNQVNLGIEFCKTSNGKVVLSRVKNANLPNGFNMKNMFQSLCENYQNAFIYLLHIPRFGIWIGATPEKLLVGEVPRFKLDALAGSRSVLNSFDWTSKEIEEQQLVTTFIEDNLINAQVEYQKSETKTIKAGDIEHLHTEFITQNCDNPMALAERMHPTPAVNGIPKMEAVGFISNTEKHDRKLYTGIIGIAENNQFNLYVNLRCGQIKTDSIDLYVGGGITKESVGEVEWNETEFKSQTLLSVIEKM